MEKQLTTTHLIAKVCKGLKINFSYSTKNKTVLKLKLPNKDHFIINSNFGLVSSTQAQLCLDKAYQYEILHNVISIPKTISYLDPKSEYGNFAKFKNHQEIIDHINSNFSYPVVIKKNTGMEGINVFLCKNNTDLINAVKKIYNQKDFRYDHVLLAQKYLEISKEYRAVFYKHKLELLYEKDNSKATFTNNLSPLHFQGAKAIDVTDQKIFNKVQNFIQPTFKNLDLIYAGYDVAIDKKGKLWLIEVNSVPGYAYYLHDNIENKIFNLFKKIIRDLVN